jgi:hypothetical protein
MGEYQLAPGVYISNINSTSLTEYPKTADAYIQELMAKGMLNDAILELELRRLQNSVEKLRESNEILA